MKKLLKIASIFCFIFINVNGQKNKIKILEEKSANRISFYALNESYTDYDVKITIKGTNIRQSKASDRFIRVPSAAKVFLKSIFLTRGKTPVYNHRLAINDSLSRRAIKRPPVSRIELPPQKIIPEKPIAIYIAKNCISCDSIVSKLAAANYEFRSYVIKENADLRKQLTKILAKPETALDSLKIPVINLGGRIYTWIEDYEQLIEELAK